MEWEGLRDPLTIPPLPLPRRTLPAAPRLRTAQILGWGAPPSPVADPGPQAESSDVLPSCTTRPSLASRKPRQLGGSASSSLSIEPYSPGSLSCSHGAEAIWAISYWTLPAIQHPSPSPSSAKSGHQTDADPREVDPGLPCSPHAPSIDKT